VNIVQAWIYVLVIHAPMEELVQRAVVATASLVSVPLVSLATFATTVSVSTMTCNDYFAWTVEMKSDVDVIAFLFNVIDCIIIC
jgi:hypothetical protein